MYAIVSLDFISCNIRTIKHTAFMGGVFQDLTYLRFVNMVNVEIQVIHCAKCVQIFIENTCTVTFPRNFLKVAYRFLREFALHTLPDSEKSIDYFNVGRFLNLQSIHLQGDGNRVSRSLKKSIFKQLPKIRILILIQCGLEHIDSETFNFIGKTLVRLDISENRLKIINPNWFSVFLDMNRMDEDKNATFLNNPLVCDCNLYEVYVLTFHVTRSYRRNHFQFDTGSCSAHFIGLVCGEQTISGKKLHLTDGNFIATQYKFVKVNLHVSNGLLIATTGFQLKFRVLVQSHVHIVKKKRSRCPSLAASLTCLLLPGSVKVLPIDKFFKRSTISTFYIVLTIGNKQVWPLHIATVHRLGERSQDGLTMGVLATLICCTEIITLGIFLIVWYKFADGFMRKFEVNDTHSVR